MGVVVEISQRPSFASVTPKAMPCVATAGSHMRADNVLRLWNSCPQSEEMTAYDRLNISLYAILLESEYEGASPWYMAETFFRIRIDRRPALALTVVRTHLARAHWLKDNVCPLLDW